MLRGESGRPAAPRGAALVLDDEARRLGRERRLEPEEGSSPQEGPRGQEGPRSGERREEAVGEQAAGGQTGTGVLAMARTCATNASMPPAASPMLRASM